MWPDWAFLNVLGDNIVGKEAQICGDILGDIEKHKFKVKTVATDIFGATFVNIWTTFSSLVTLFRPISPSRWINYRQTGFKLRICIWKATTTAITSLRQKVDQIFLDGFNYFLITTLTRGNPYLAVRPSLQTLSYVAGGNPRRYVCNHKNTLQWNSII